MNIKYKTEQKKLILDYLVDNENKFVNVEDIMLNLKKRKLNVGLTTIYRFLNFLEENNNVRTEVRDHKKYYQYVSKDCDKHLFLKCKNCGKAMNLNCEEFENVNEHIKKEHKFNLDFNTIIYGTCEKCSDKEKKNK